MRSVPLSDLNRRPGEVVDMALTAPLVLTKHGRRSVVMIAADAYDALVSGVRVTSRDIASVASKSRAAPSFLARQAAKARTTEDE